jgi:hypothetical protein
MRAFTDLACVATCQTGHRGENEANCIGEAVAVLQISAAQSVPQDSPVDVADLYPVDGLTKFTRVPPVAE